MLVNLSKDAVIGKSLEKLLLQVAPTVCQKEAFSQFASHRRMSTHCAYGYATLSLEFLSVVLKIVGPIQYNHYFDFTLVTVLSFV